MKRKGRLSVSPGIARSEVFLELMPQQISQIFAALGGRNAHISRFVILGRYFRHTIAEQTLGMRTELEEANRPEM